MRLLEVTSKVPATGDVMPFGFGGSAEHGMPLPLVIILLAPEEWADMRAGKLKLPRSWGGVERLVRLQPAAA